MVRKLYFNIATAQYFSLIFVPSTLINVAPIKQYNYEVLTLSG